MLWFILAFTVFTATFGENSQAPPSHDDSELLEILCHMMGNETNIVKHALQCIEENTGLTFQNVDECFPDGVEKGIIECCANRDQELSPCMDEYLHKVVDHYVNDDSKEGRKMRECILSP